MTTKPTQFRDWPASIEPGFGPYRAVVESITDGDTLRAMLDLGVNQFAYHSVRLLDVEAPELFTGTDREAGARARDKLSEICPPGTKLLMQTQRDKTTFGRYIADLLRSDGVNVNQEMRAWLAMQE